MRSPDIQEACRMQPGGTSLPPEYLDRLTDAIVSLEYYIETLQAGRSDPWYMLDNARTCLDALARALERVLPTVAPVSAGTFAKTLRIMPLQSIDTAETVGGTTDVRKVETKIAVEPPMLAAVTAASIAARRYLAPTRT